MAEEQITVDFDDKSLFQSALQDTPPAPSSPDPAPTEALPASPAPSPQAAPPPPAGDRPRDDRGRFTPVQPDAAAAPQPPPGQTSPAPGPDEGTVPSWRLREEREQREAYASQLAERDRQLREVVAYVQQMQRQSQPQPQAPDPLLNPAEWNAYQGNAMQQLHQNVMHQLRTNQLESNLQLTRMERGPEHFDAAYNAFMRSAEGDVAFARSIVNSPNPGAAMCDWYNRAMALETYGADPEAYFTRRVEQLLQDKSFLAKAIDAARNMTSQMGAQGVGGVGRVPSNVTVIPPSLSTMRSGSTPESGVTNAAGEDLMSDQMLFQAALAPNQHRR